MENKGHVDGIKKSIEDIIKVKNLMKKIFKKKNLKK